MTVPEGPLVTVGIPAFNGERYIGLAIKSVLSQSYGKFELVVVDDRSSDGTVGVVKSFADPRLRIIENPSRLGQKGNWNKTLGEARGRLIKLLPQDDLLYPSCLERQVEAFARPDNAGVALVCCARDIIGPAGRVIWKRSFRRRQGRLDGVEAVRKCLRAGTNLIGEPAAVLFRSETARAVGLFDDRAFYVIDLDYWCRVLLTGDLYVLPESLCAFRVSRDSASLRVAASQDKDFRAFIRFLARDGSYRVSWWDGLQGEAKARLNRLLRQLFYRVVAKEAR